MQYLNDLPVTNQPAHVYFLNLIGVIYLF